MMVLTMMMATMMMGCDADGASDVDDDVVVQASGGPDGAAAELRAHLGLAWAVGFHLFNRFSSF